MDLPALSDFSPATERGGRSLPSTDAGRRRDERGGGFFRNLADAAEAVSAVLQTAEPLTLRTGAR